MTMDLRLRPRAAARYLGISTSSLAKRRMRGDPPRYLKFGRSVAYDVRDLDGFLAASRYNSTSEYQVSMPRDFETRIESPAADQRVPSTKAAADASGHEPAPLPPANGESHRRPSEQGPKISGPRTAERGSAP
jgi:hypothetical protein